MNQEIIYEFTPQGSYMKVTAVDTESGIEVSTVTPRNLSQVAQEHIALKKLLYVLDKAE